MNTVKIADLAKEIYETNKKNGFWDEPRQSKTLSLLFASEVLEAFETIRKNPDLPSEKCPGRKHYHEELADVVIRLLDVLYGLHPEVFIQGTWEKFETKKIIHDEINLLWTLNNLFANSPAPLATEMTGKQYNLFTDFVTAISLIENHTGLMIWDVVQEKLAFNKTRPFKHGKQF